MENINIREAVTLTKLCAQIILENNGETYRAEETVMFIGRSLGYDTEVISFPIGFIITIADENDNVDTIIKRIKSRKIDLGAIHEVNDLSRRIVNGSIDIKVAIAKLRELHSKRDKPSPFLYTAASLSPAAFSLLYGGGLFDAFVSAICGFLVQYVYSNFDVDDNYNFAMSLISGAMIAIIAILFVNVCNTGNTNIIITAAITPLLPGLVMTTAIRDAMRGDLLSGLARLAEAILVAIALAFGIGAVLTTFYGA